MELNLDPLEKVILELKQSSDILNRAEAALVAVENCINVLPPSMLIDRNGNPIEDRKIIYGMIPGYLSWTMSHCERTEKLHIEMNKVREHLFPNGDDGCRSNMNFFEWVKPYLKAPEEKK